MVNVREAGNLAEAFSTPSRTGRGLSLENVKGIKFGRMFLTPQDLNADERRFKGITYIADIAQMEERFSSGDSYSQHIIHLAQLTDEELVRVFTNQRLPFRIIGDRSALEPVTLTAEVSRSSKETLSKGFQTHAIRLIPEAGGRIGKVELNKGHNMEITGMNLDPYGSLSVEFGNELINVEFKFSHEKDLPPIQPPQRKAKIIRL